MSSDRANRSPPPPRPTGDYSVPQIPSYAEIRRRQAQRSDSAPAHAEREPRSPSTSRAFPSMTQPEPEPPSLPPRSPSLSPPRFWMVGGEVVGNRPGPVPDWIRRRVEFRNRGWRFTDQTVDRTGREDLRTPPAPSPPTRNSFYPPLAPDENPEAGQRETVSGWEDPEVLGSISFTVAVPEQQRRGYDAVRDGSEEMDEQDDDFDRRSTVDLTLPVHWDIPMDNERFEIQMELIRRERLQMRERERRRNVALEALRNARGTAPADFDEEEDIRQIHDETDAGIEQVENRMRGRMTPPVHRNRRSALADLVEEDEDSESRRREFVEGLLADLDRMVNMARMNRHGNPNEASSSVGEREERTGAAEVAEEEDMNSADEREEQTVSLEPDEQEDVDSAEEREERTGTPEVEEEEELPQHYDEIYMGDVVPQRIIENEQEWLSYVEEQERAERRRQDRIRDTRAFRWLADENREYPLSGLAEIEHELGVADSMSPDYPERGRSGFDDGPFDNGQSRHFRRFQREYGSRNRFNESGAGGERFRSRYRDLSPDSFEREMETSPFLDRLRPSSFSYPHAWEPEAPLTAFDEPNEAGTGSNEAEPNSNWDTEAILRSWEADTIFRPPSASTPPPNSRGETLAHRESPENDSSGEVRHGSEDEPLENPEMVCEGAGNILPNSVLNAMTRDGVRILSLSEDENGRIRMQAERDEELLLAESSDEDNDTDNTTGGNDGSDISNPVNENAVTGQNDGNQMFPNPGNTRYMEWLSPREIEEMIRNGARVNGITDHPVPIARFRRLNRRVNERGYWSYESEDEGNEEEGGVDHEEEDEKEEFNNEEVEVEVGEERYGNEEEGEGNPGEADLADRENPKRRKLN